MKKTVSLLLSFLLMVNNVSFAGGRCYRENVNSGMNLSPSLVFGSLGDDIHQKYLVLAKMALQTDLKELDTIGDIVDADDIETVQKAFNDHTRFRKEQEYDKKDKYKPTTKCFFNNVKQVAEGRKLFYVPVFVDVPGQKGQKYVLLFSTKKDKNKGFPSAVCTQAQLEEIKERLKDSDTLPVFTVEDAFAMKRYEQQEIYDREVIAWVHQPERESELVSEIDVRGEIEEILKTAKVNVTDKENLLNRKCFIVKRTEGVSGRLNKHKVTVVTVDGESREVVADAHSSNGAIHIFCNDKAYKKHLEHEVGVILGYAVEKFCEAGNGVYSEFDERIEKSGELSSDVTRTTIDLDKNLKTRDYAMGLFRKSPEQKALAQFNKIREKLVTQLAPEEKVLRNDDLSKALTPPESLTANARRVISDLLTQNDIDPDYIAEENYYFLIRSVALERQHLSLNSSNVYGEGIAKKLIDDPTITNRDLNEAVNKKVISPAILDALRREISASGNPDAERILWTQQAMIWVLSLLSIKKQTVTEVGIYETQSELRKQENQRNDEDLYLQLKFFAAGQKIDDSLVYDEELKSEDLALADKGKLAPEAVERIKAAYVQHDVDIEKISFIMGENRLKESMLMSLKKIQMLRKYKFPVHEIIIRSRAWERLKGIGGMLPSYIKVEGDENGDITNRRGHILRGLEIALGFNKTVMRKKEENLIKAVAYTHELGRLPFVHYVERRVKDYFTMFKGIFKPMREGTGTSERFSQVIAQNILYEEIGIDKKNKFNPSLRQDIEHILEKEFNKIKSEEAKIFYLADEILGYVEDFVLMYKTEYKGKRMVSDFEGMEDFLEFIFGSSDLSEINALEMKDFNDFVVKTSLSLMERAIDKHTLTYKRGMKNRLDEHKDRFTKKMFPAVDDFVKLSTTMEPIFKCAKQILIDRQGLPADALKEEAVLRMLLKMTEQDLWKLVSSKKYTEFLKSNNFDETDFPPIFSWVMGSSEDKLLKEAREKIVASGYTGQYVDKASLKEALIGVGNDPKHLLADMDSELSALIFSKEVTFDNGVGILLPQLVKAGLKVGVIAPAKEQRQLIKSLNDNELKDEKNKIICGKDLADVTSKLRHGTSRYFYFKAKGELIDESLDPSIRVVDESIVEQIIKAIGIADKIDIEKMTKLQEAAKAFSVAA